MNVERKVGRSELLSASTSSPKARRVDTQLCKRNLAPRIRVKSHAVRTVTEDQHSEESEGLSPIHHSPQ